VHFDEVPVFGGKSILRFLDVFLRNKSKNVRYIMTFGYITCITELKHINSFSAAERVASVWQGSSVYMKKLM